MAYAAPAKEASSDQKETTNSKIKHHCSESGCLICQTTPPFNMPSDKETGKPHARTNMQARGGKLSPTPTLLKSPAAPSMACSRCQKYQHSVDGVCEDDTAASSATATPQCAESGDIFSIGRYDRDDSECRQATWVEEQLGQEVERPTTDRGIKEVFQNIRVFLPQSSSETQTRNRQRKRENSFKASQYIKDEIESLQENQYKRSHGLSGALKNPGERESVELVLPKADTSETYRSHQRMRRERCRSCSAGGSLRCLTGTRRHPPLKRHASHEARKVADGFEYACFVNAPVRAETIQHDQDYLCKGKKFYVNSPLASHACHQTCQRNRELIVTGTNIDCGLTLAEGNLPSSAANYEKVSEANCTKEGFQPTVCKCARDGFRKITLETANNATSDPSQSEERHASHGPSEQKTATRTEKSFRQERQRAMPHAEKYVQKD